MAELPRAMTTDCVFCGIVAGKAPATVVREWPDSIAIVPLSPVVDGHVLIIPRLHVADAGVNAALAGAMMVHAAEWARRYESSNIIVSSGAAATQSVFHLHVHVIPRVMGDQLMVPWGTLHGENPRDPHRCKAMIALEDALARLLDPGSPEWTFNESQAAYFTARRHAASVLSGKAYAGAHRRGADRGGGRR